MVSETQIAPHTSPQRVGGCSWPGEHVHPSRMSTQMARPAEREGSPTPPWVGTVSWYALPPLSTDNNDPGAAICAISGSSRGCRRRAPPSTAPKTCAEPGGAQLVGLAGAVGPEGAPAKPRGPSRAKDAVHLPSVDQARSEPTQPHEAMRACTIVEPENYVNTKC